MPFALIIALPSFDPTGQTAMHPHEARTAVRAWDKLDSLVLSLPVAHQELGLADRRELLGRVGNRFTAERMRRTVVDAQPTAVHAHRNLVAGATVLTGQRRQRGLRQRGRLRRLHV